jgi:hypothetical protein
MWTMAASLSEKYAPWEDLLYQRARKYIEAQEMKVSVGSTRPPSGLHNSTGTWRGLRLNLPCAG